ncbi:MAG: ATP-binding protein, partial [Candidatus Gastranaerophilales bacterium]|nr:ATP-binding protein [Candidatus Gastranaerophilales bacterium]
MRILNITAKPYMTFRGNDSKIKKNIGVLESFTSEVQEEMDRTAKIDVLYYRLMHQLNDYRDINEIKKQYAIINGILDGSSGVNYEKDALIVSKYIEQMSRLAKNKGLNKVAGYDDIKNYLYEEFILKVMAKEKTSQGADIPNAFLFYGPTGCGKTLFAQALAEHTLSDVKVVKSCSGNNEQEAFDNIMKYAQEAKETYENSGEDKKRTIIILNEAEFLLYEDSPVLDQFKEFVKDCADKYKCTVFLTSNYPLDIDKSILSNEITPYKLLIAQPNRDDAKKIIRKRLDVLQRPSINIDKL